jgi:hypothetical protein
MTGKKNFRVKPNMKDLKEHIRKVMDEVVKEEIDESDPARRMKELMQGAEPKNDNEKKLLAEIKQMIAEGKIIDIPGM